MISVLHFELRFWLRNPLTWITAAGLLFLPLFLFLGTAGVFDSPSPELFMDGSPINSPIRIAQSLASVSDMLIWLTAAFFGGSLFRDFSSRTHNMLYSYPVQPSKYLFAKWISAAIIMFHLSLLPVISLIAGEWIFYQIVDLPLTISFSGYLITFVLYTIPNIWIAGTLVFTVITLTRDIYAVYIFVILIWVSQLVTGIFSSSEPVLSQLTDITGNLAFFSDETKWSPRIDQGVDVIPGTTFLVNRLIWLALSTLTGLLALSKFELSVTSDSTSGLSQYFRKYLRFTDSESGPFSRIRNKFRRQHTSAFHGLVSSNIRFILNSWHFWFVTMLGILLTVFVSIRVTNSGPFQLLPLDALILGAPVIFYTQFMILVTILYAGKFVLRDHVTEMYVLTTITPVATYLRPLSLVTATAVFQLLLLTIFIITVEVIQLMAGFTPGFSIILKYVVLFCYPQLLIWSMVSVFAYTFTRSLLTGVVILITLWLSPLAAEQVGLDSPFLAFNNYPVLRYSDLSGYGKQLSFQLFFQSYWALWAGLLFISSIILSERDSTRRLSDQFLDFFRSMYDRFRLPSASIAILILGFTIIGNRGGDPLSNELLFSQKRVIDEQYPYLSGLHQPVIEHIEIDIDLFPVDNSFEATGVYTLVNRNEVSIDTLIIRKSVDEPTDIHFANSFRSVIYDSVLQLHVIALDNALGVGDSLKLHFQIRNEPNTFFKTTSTVGSDYTYLTQDILPRIGYFPPEEWPLPDSSYKYTKHLYAQDSHKLTINTRITTDESQTPLATGKLLTTRIEDGRRFAEYQTKEPVKLNLYFISQSLTEYSFMAGGISVTAYLHPQHANAMPSIRSGIEAALTYNSENFGDPDFSTLRVIEYPSTMGSGNTLKDQSLMLNEEIFRLKPDSEGRSELQFYITAHELTHHWFGNLLMPAATKGATVLTESITEYISYMLLTEQFGDLSGDQFLKIQHDRYRAGRKRSGKPESPLIFSEPEEEYITYGKGSLVLYDLCERLKGSRCSQALSDFLQTYKSDHEYPTSYDLYHVFVDVYRSESMDPDLVSKHFMNAGDPVLLFPDTHFFDRD